MHILPLIKFNNVMAARRLALDSARAERSGKALEFGLKLSDLIVNNY